MDYLRKTLKSTREDPYGYFYLLYKLHKNPIKTRPVCSDCASTTHGLGQWVNEILQPVALAQRAYSKDSFALKNRLNKVELDPELWYSIFSLDAVSMYTNIDTEGCIKRLSDFLLLEKNQKRFGYPAKALIEAISIVMRNNRMRFGDLIFQQLVGVAMGISPAPPIANIYVAMFELQNIFDQFQDYLLLYLRFIDDGIVIWQHSNDKAADSKAFEDFKTTINKSGLTWEFTKPGHSLDFMDMQIELGKRKIETNLFQKPMALHLYILPNSCHPPGNLGSLVSGMTLRIHRLCSRSSDIDFWLKEFYSHLRDRGYKQQHLISLLDKAIVTANNFLKRSPWKIEKLKREKAANSKRRVAFHLKFHPNDPSSTTLQNLFRKCLFSPEDEAPLKSLKNFDDIPIPLDGAVIAYHRYHNLCNLLSYRKIDKTPGGLKCHHSFDSTLVGPLLILLLTWQELPAAALLPCEKQNKF